MEKISSDEIRRISRVILGVLRAEGNSIAELCKKCKSYPVEGFPGQAVSFEDRPSNEGTTAHAVSYIIDGRGIPVELKINEALFYTSLIVKSGHSFPGYTEFAEDYCGNRVQQKKIGSVDLGAVVRELEQLAN